MRQDPHYFAILDGIGIAYTVGNDASGDFQAWLGELACYDLVDNGDRVIKFAAETVANVIDGISGSLMDLSAEDREVLLATHQFFQSLKLIREMALNFGLARTGDD
ncbi:hypothetical protein K3181_13335 [Qipengyuania sp. YG27]|uniref:Uncharacterized protein n=1 Tax=Qipengyuania mesophila TaxID=2867246 RepID=A0ABS7JXP7_9SPHN|nr:hypothetical protein [Qipengyuania mesophila]MBX7502425.1 hypothetical protein [Qipengyuania mesophila]